MIIYLIFQIIHINYDFFSIIQNNQYILIFSLIKIYNYGKLSY